MTNRKRPRFSTKSGGQKYTIQRSKGLGENEPDMMCLTTMNPATRRLIKVTARRRGATRPQMFDLLLGDNLSGRKDYHRRTRRIDVFWTMAGRLLIVPAILPKTKRIAEASGSDNMAPRRKKNARRKPKASARNPDAYIAGAGRGENQPITDTLETNYMPYAMSVIVSRAIPEIDGFKPSHRKLLYTMYKMGLLNSATAPNRPTSSGQTMKLNPHGDAAIYETMVRLTRGI